MSVPNNRSLYLLGDEDSLEKVEKSSYEAHKGHKLAVKQVKTDTKYVRVTEGVRQDHKKFVWIQRNGEVKLTLSGWHDE